MNPGYKDSRVHVVKSKPRVTSPGPGLMHDTGCLGLVHWDNPEGGAGSLSLLQEFSEILQARILKWVSHSVISVAQSCPTLCDPMDCNMPGFPVSYHLPESTKLKSTELMMLSNHLILCCPFSSCLQSFPASGSFPMSWLFASGGQSIGPLASVSVLLMNTQG